MRLKVSNMHPHYKDRSDAEGYTYTAYLSKMHSKNHNRPEERRRESRQVHTNNAQSSHSSTRPFEQQTLKTSERSINRRISRHRSRDCVRIRSSWRSQPHPCCTRILVGKTLCRWFSRMRYSRKVPVVRYPRSGRSTLSKLQI